MPFSSLGLSQPLLDALARNNFTQPYPIQQEAIPSIIAKRDVLGIAPTGSGKTASYVLPILENMQAGTVSQNRHAEVLVLVPTRELALQVAEVFRLFSQELAPRLKTVALFGGVSINPQMLSLQGAHIVVATPGRLLDLVESNAVHLRSISCLVLDEADKMLHLGFKDEMDRIFGLLPQRRQNLLFSATLTGKVQGINRVLLRNPQTISIEPEAESIDLICQSAYFIPEEKKGPLLRYLIQEKDLQQVLVFASSVFRCEAIVDKLLKHDIDAASIHSQKSQNSRMCCLERFKNGKLRVLVATDLLARGIDIEFLPHVINYELPRSPKDYIHRIGRTGRAESPGEAISFVMPADEHHFKIIQKKMGKWIDRIDASSLPI
jgi:ATP-dependent RNA helicase RhlE